MDQRNHPAARILSKTMFSNLFQSLDGMVRPSGKVFYGWWIVATAGGVQWFSALLWMSSYGAYVVLLQEEFDWSKAALSGAFALTRIESGILGPLQGWLVDRFGPRPILTIGMVLFGLGFVLFSQVQSLLTFYLTFFLIALGASLGGYATLMVSLVNWFRRYRGTAVSWSQLGYSLGGLCLPLIALALEEFGWRSVALASGLAVWTIGIPLVQLVRHRPEDYGEVPDGVAMTQEEHEAAALGVEFTARQAMRTRAFWLISVGHALALLIVSSVMVHLIAHLTEGQGFSLVEASQVFLLLTIFQMIGQTTGGAIGDRFNKRLVCVCCMVAHTAGMLLITYTTTFTGIFIFCMLHGLAWGVRGPMMVAIRADYFGTKAFGTIMGFSSLVVMLGMSGGPLVAGFLADIYGDYQIGFTILAGAALLGSLSFLAATPPPPPKKEEVS